MTLGWQWFFGIATVVGLAIALYALRKSAESDRRSAENEQKLLDTTTSVGEGLAELNRIYGTFARSLETLEARATRDTLPVLQNARVFALGSQNVVQELGQDLYTKVPGLPESFKFWTEQGAGSNLPQGTRYAIINDRVVPIPPDESGF